MGRNTGVQTKCPVCGKPGTLRLDKGRYFRIWHYDKIAYELELGKSKGMKYCYVGATRPAVELVRKSKLSAKDRKFIINALFQLGDYGQSLWVDPKVEPPKLTNQELSMLADLLHTLREILREMKRSRKITSNLNK